MGRERERERERERGSFLGNAKDFYHQQYGLDGGVLTCGASGSRVDGAGSADFGGFMFGIP